MTASVLSYGYLRPSAVRESAASRTLPLEASGGAAPAGAAAHPRLFGGFLTAPAAAAAAILAVADVAAARFDQSAAASLRALAPTAAENARFTKEHLALLEVSWYSSSAAAVIGYAQEALLGADLAGLLDAEAFTEVSDRVRNRPALGTTDYRVAGFVSLFSAGTAIDRGALIRRIFADLITIAPPPEDAAHVVVALALTPAEHAGVTDDLLRLVEPQLAVLLQEDGRKAIAASLAFGLLGRQLETLLRAGMIHANRVAASLRAAAETGAYGTVWAVIEAALPGLLRGTPFKDAAVFLSLAVECVSRCGAKGEIAEVVAAAERGGSSQTAKNARLLRDALR